MEVLDIGLVIPAIIPPTSVTMIVFQWMKFFECLMVMEDLDIGLLIPDTLPLATAEFLMLVMMLEMCLGLKRPTTLPVAIL